MDLKTESCPICDFSNIKTSVSSVDNIWPEKHAVSYCPNCEVYFLEKKPLLMDVENYYKTAYFKLSFFMLMIKNLFRKFRCASQFSYIKKSIPEPIDNYHILEIGADDAKLLNCFSHKNFVTGLEYSDKYREFAKRRYGIELINCDISELNSRFNLILMSHVFEHFLDTESILIKIRKILLDGGYLFLEIPNSPSLNSCDEWNKKYLSGAHIYNFSVKGIKILAEKYKFRIISLDRFYYNFPSNYSMSKKKALGRFFLEGKEIKFTYLFDIIMYILRSMINAQMSYKKVNINEQYLGLGDNIRIIFKK